MAKGDYVTEEFPSDEELRREALTCPLLAHCPDRPFSFCLKGWINKEHKLYFRKVTYKHCYECMRGIQ